MTNATIDNSISEEIREVITWQYDNAPNLIQFVYMIGDMFTQSTANMWNQFVKKTNIADNGTTSGSSTTYEWDDYGLALWGKILGVQRYDGMSSNLYRKIIVARMCLLNGYYTTDTSGNQTFNPAAGTVNNYIRYVKAIFGNAVSVSDGNDMSLTFTQTGLSGELLTLFSNHPDIAFVWPAGVRSNASYSGLVFGLDGQQTGTTSSDPTIGHLDESCFYWKKRIQSPKGDGTYVWSDCEDVPDGLL